MEEETQRPNSPFPRYSSMLFPELKTFSSPAFFTFLGSAREEGLGGAGTKKKEGRGQLFDSRIRRIREKEKRQTFFPFRF